jgi:hypothetical protein
MMEQRTISRRKKKESKGGGIGKARFRSEGGWREWERVGNKD